MDESIQAIEQLREDLMQRPSSSLIYAARWISAAADIDGVQLPDFVQILANGNPEAWEAVLRLAQADVKYEAEAGNASAQ